MDASALVRCQGPCLWLMRMSELDRIILLSNLWYPTVWLASLLSLGIGCRLWSLVLAACCLMIFLLIILSQVNYIMVHLAWGIVFDGGCLEPVPPAASRNQAGDNFQAEEDCWWVKVGDSCGNAGAELYHWNMLDIWVTFALRLVQVLLILKDTLNYQLVSLRHL